MRLFGIVCLTHTVINTMAILTLNFLRFVLLALFLFSVLFSASPKHEVRAVWLSSASGDWPKTYNKEEQQQSLTEIFALLKRYNFNTIYFQVRLRGNTMYRSDIEPWAQQLTGVLGKDPGWDPLQFAITEARKQGMELHAWFNVAKVWGLDVPPAHARHLLKAHPEWVQQVEGEWWLDMGIQQARDYTVNVVMELVSKYDIDGIQFDFIRYPNALFDDWETFAAIGDGVERSQWRRNSITLFVRECYAKISALKPTLKVGSTPIGIYKSINGAQSSFTGYDGVFQDSRLWLQEKMHDYLAPQIYWTIGEQQNPNDPDFSALCSDWARESFGRHIYTGIGIYRDNVREETSAQIAVSRNTGALGQAYFRFEQLPSIFSQLRRAYPSPSLVPPMKWKDSIPPLPPINCTITYNSKTVLQWNEPPQAEDGEKPFRYVVYRSKTEPVDISNSGNILAVVPSAINSYVDDSAAEKYFYTVTSLDRLWNESGDNGIDNELLITNRMRRGNFLLSQNYPEPFSSTTFVSFEIPSRSNVILSLIPVETQKETVIVNELKNAGTHVIAIDGKLLPAGDIECKLTVGGNTISRWMKKITEEKK